MGRSVSVFVGCLSTVIGDIQPTLVTALCQIGIVCCCAGVARPISRQGGLSESRRNRPFSH